MADPFASEVRHAQKKAFLGLLFCCNAVALAVDWPQYRGPTTDGISPDLISTNWPATGPPVVWPNMSLTNGFSTFAVSQGRGFVLISRDDGSGQLLDYCVAVDAATGANIWATPIGNEPWDPNYTGDGGAGVAPYYKGDGPRTTPAVKDGRVVALAGQFYGEFHLVCMNTTNGSVLWSNELVSAYGASTIAWDNAASPCLDDDLIFVNLNSSTNNQNLVAFRMADGSMAWSSQNENVTHATPVVAPFKVSARLCLPPGLAWFRWSGARVRFFGSLPIPLRRLTLRWAHHLWFIQIWSIARRGITGGPQPSELL